MNVIVTSHASVVDLTLGEVRVSLENVDFSYDEDGQLEDVFYHDSFVYITDDIWIKVDLEEVFQCKEEGMSKNNLSWLKIRNDLLHTVRMGLADGSLEIVE